MWKYEYGLFSGVACSLPEQAIVALEKNPNVAGVELNVQVHALDVELENSWGVDHIEADVVHGSGNTGDDIGVAIRDTGVDAYPDLDGSVVEWGDYVGDIVEIENAYDDMVMGPIVRA